MSGASEQLAEFGRPIVFRPELRPVCGSVNATIMLSVALYQQVKAGEGKPWCFGAGRWQALTTFTRNEQKTARAKLRKAGFLVEHRVSNGKVTWYQVDMEALREALYQHRSGAGPGRYDRDWEPTDDVPPQCLIPDPVLSHRGPGSREPGNQVPGHRVGGVKSPGDPVREHRGAGAEAPGTRFESTGNPVREHRHREKEEPRQTKRPQNPKTPKPLA